MAAPASRLAAVPAGLFGIVLGLAGLGGAWRIAATLWDVPTWVGEGIYLVATLVWLVLVLLYALKWLRYRAEALVEFRHPVLCCFVGIVPVSTALIALAVRPYHEPLAIVLAVVGIAGQLAFGVFRTGELWKGNREPAATTPILYLPTVAGSFVSAIVLAAFGHPGWGVPFFGAGVLSWLAIESVLLHRLYVVAELPPPLRPTLGIQLAPPAVGCVAYLAITSGAPDLVSQAMLGYALFQALVLLRLLPWIARQPFIAGYWAFTFGASALAAACIQFVRRGGTGPLALAAPYLFAAANLVIGIIALRTLLLLLRGQLVLPPPPLTVPSGSPRAAP
jgi:tellurite resistance protein